MARHVITPGPLQAAFFPGIAGGTAQALRDAGGPEVASQLSPLTRFTVDNPYWTRFGLQVGGGTLGGLTSLALQDHPDVKSGKTWMGVSAGIFASLLADGILKSRNVRLLRDKVMAGGDPDMDRLNQGVRRVAKNTALKDALHALAGNVHRGAGNEGYVLAAQSMAENRPVHKESPIGLSALVSGAASAIPPPFENVVVAGTALLRGNSAIDRARDIVSQGNLEQ